MKSKANTVMYETSLERIFLFRLDCLTSRLGRELHVLPVQGECRVTSTTYVDNFFMLKSLLQLLKITVVRQLA